MIGINYYMQTHACLRVIFMPEPYNIVYITQIENTIHYKLLQSVSVSFSLAHSRPDQIKSSQQDRKFSLLHRREASKARVWDSFSSSVSQFLTKGSRQLTVNLLSDVFLLYDSRKCNSLYDSEDFYWRVLRCFIWLSEILFSKSLKDNLTHALSKIQCAQLNNSRMQAYADSNSYFTLQMLFHHILTYIYCTLEATEILINKTQTQNLKSDTGEVRWSSPGCENARASHSW